MTTDALAAIEARLSRGPVVPLIKSNEPEQALEVMKALVDGGLGVIEVVMRTPRALDVVATLAETSGDAIVGAGTVLNATHARDAVAAGARFLVSPGLDESVVAVARELDVPLLPGVATATEAQRAWNLGLRYVKFFPAVQAGGAAMVKALASVFSDLRFMPTGGVAPDNLADFLAVDAVLACGGSWLTPGAAIAAGKLDIVRDLARDAVTLSREAGR